MYECFWADWYVSLSLGVPVEEPWKDADCVVASGMVSQYNLPIGKSFSFGLEDKTDLRYRRPIPHQESDTDRP